MEARTQYGSAAAPAQLTKPQTASELELIQRDLCNVIENLITTRQIARETGDRLFGPQPEAVSEDKDPPPSCAVGKLARAVTYLTRTADDLRHQVDRLSRL